MVMGIVTKILVLNGIFQRWARDNTAATTWSCFHATRSARPGFKSWPGASPQGDLRGGRSLCAYCTNKERKHWAHVGCKWNVWLLYYVYICCCYCTPIRHWTLNMFSIFLALSQKLYYIVAMSPKIVACPALLTKMLNLKAMQASTPGLLGERTIVFSVSLKGRPAAYRNFCSASWGRGRFSASRAARSVLGNDDFQKQHFIPLAANVYKNIFQLFKGTENLKNL